MNSEVNEEKKDRRNCIMTFNDFNTLLFDS